MATTPTTLDPRFRCARAGRSRGVGVSSLRFSRRAASSRLRLAVAISFGAWVLAAATVDADTFRVEPSIEIQELLTNNVVLSPSGSAKSDLVTQLTPGLSVSEAGARTSLKGTVSLPILLYANTGSENNQVVVNANLQGSVEAVEKFFFIDGAVLFSQQYFSPFGPQPPGLANATQNRYTTQSYRVSPYIKGGVPGEVQYLLRDDSVWTDLNGAPVAGLNGAYSNQLLANVSRQRGQFGLGAEYNRSSVKFSSQPSLLTQIGRLRVFDNVDPALQLSASGGYEDDDYTFSHFRGSTYGVGGVWHPTDRTNIEATWEHRFFGSSYLLNFTHRTPLTVWNLSASRNIMTYPQQLATLPAGFEVQGLLNLLFLSNIPDPVQRQAFIDQFIRDRGLPGFLSSPLSLYTQQITLQETASASVGLLGARNSILFSVFYLRQQPITAPSGELPGLLAALNDNTQQGASAVWTQTLAPRLLFTLSGGVTRAENHVPQIALATTRQGYISAVLTSRLSPNTSLNGGVRYQLSRADALNSYTEAAVFVGLSHTFR